MTSPSTLTRTCPCEPTCRRQPRDVSSLSAISEAFNDRCQRQQFVSLMLSKLDYGNASLASIPANLLCRLQSVLNSEARTIIVLPRSTLMLHCLHGMVSRYLSTNFIRVADVPACRRLRSSTTNSIIVRQTRLVTVGDHAFSVAGANLWNSLPNEITSLDSQKFLPPSTKNFSLSRFIPGLLLQGDIRNLVPGTSR